MANIKLDIDHSIQDGLELVFKSPCDCTLITGLNIHHLNEEGRKVRSSFVFKDAHGNNLSDTDLFAKDAYVKVILNSTDGIAYIQNADTNKYLEGRFEQLSNDFSTDISIERNRINEIIAGYPIEGDSSITRFEFGEDDIADAKTISQAVIVTNGLHAKLYLDCRLNVSPLANRELLIIPDEVAPFNDYVDDIDTGNDEISVRMRDGVLQYNAKVSTVTNNRVTIEYEYSLSQPYYAIPEIVDARIDNNGVIHESLGDAIRSKLPMKFIDKIICRGKLITLNVGTDVVQNQCIPFRYLNTEGYSCKINYKVTNIGDNGDANADEDAIYTQIYGEAYGGDQTREFIEDEIHVEGNMDLFPPDSYDIEVISMECEGMYFDITRPCSLTAITSANVNDGRDYYIPIGNGYEPARIILIEQLRRIFGSNIQGSTDWNDIDNKPFYMTTEHITYDPNKEYYTIGSGVQTQYKVSDKIIREEEFIKSGMTVTFENGSEVGISSAIIPNNEKNGKWYNTLYGIGCVFDSELAGQPTGIYFSAYNWSECGIPIKLGPFVVEKLKPEYLPEYLPEYTPDGDVNLSNYYNKQEIDAKFSKVNKNIGDAEVLLSNI